MIFAKTFSASSYSKECSRAMARLKSFFTFPEQDVSNSTDPNCLPGGPHTTTSPCLRLMASIISLEGAVSLGWHEENANKKRPKNTGGDVCNAFFILADYNFSRYI